MFTWHRRRGGTRGIGRGSGKLGLAQISAKGQGVLERLPWLQEGERLPRLTYLSRLLKRSAARFLFRISFTTTMDAGSFPQVRDTRSIAFHDPLHDTGLLRRDHVRCYLVKAGEMAVVQDCVTMDIPDHDAGKALLQGIVGNAPAVSRVILLWRGVNEIDP